MIRRAAFVLISLFWLTMNALLWRAEFGDGKATGSSVPLEMVWHRILTAPDSSSMEIFHREQKLGYLRWTPNIGEALVPNNSTSEEPVDGMVKTPTGYSVELEGNILAGDPTNRFRAHLHLDFDTNQAWREVALTLALRTNSWSLKARSREQNLELKVEQDGVNWQRRFSFAELQNPGNLLGEFGLPFGPGTLPGLSGLAANKLASRVAWRARNDLLKVGHSQLRVYRLQAHLLERYEILVTVSRVGEILRVDLPDAIVFKNEVALNW